MVNPTQNQNPDGSGGFISQTEIDQAIKSMNDRYKRTMKRFSLVAIVIMSVFLLIAFKVWLSPSQVPAKVERLEKKIQQYEKDIRTAQLQKDSVMQMIKEQREEMEVLKQLDADLVESYNQTQDELYEIRKQKNKNDQRIDRFSSTDIKEYFAREFGK